MKRILVLTAMLVWAAVLTITTAVAQQNAAPMPPTPVIEIFGCKFNANKGINDLHSVTARWNAWADKNLSLIHI